MEKSEGNEKSINGSRGSSIPRTHMVRSRRSVGYGGILPPRARRMGTLVATGIATLILVIGSGIVGTTGVASAGVASTPKVAQAGVSQVASAAPTAVPMGSGEGWYKCIAYTGWGFVEVGAMVASGPTPWFFPSFLSAQLAAKDANKACGWHTMEKHVGFREICGSRFLYFSPVNGKAVYDYRNIVPCAGVDPKQLDNVFCAYIKPEWSADACWWQFLRNLQEQQNQNAPLYVAGGGGGGSW